MASEPFKVIIVGGGPSGLTAAYALHHAGIDFVVLERRSNVVEDLGASLVLGPPSMRVFHQFGIFDKLIEIGGLVKVNKGLTPDGRVFKQVFMEDFRQNHGLEAVAFHRAHLIKALYDNLPDAAKARYHTGKKLAGIKSTETGVIVTCDDGSSYAGSVVIGADGVHSATRRHMRELAIAEDPSREETWDAVNPFETNYQCMWASFPRPTEAGQNYDIQGTDKSVMYVTGKERGWIFCYEKLPKPTKERISFTEEDLEAYGQRFADWHVTETLKLKDVFKERYNTGAAGLEEGLCKNWSWGGRVVLVGDAAHKFTPNAGLGFNNGVQDIVVLCNKLQKLVSASRGSPPDFASLEAQFQEYREERVDVVSTDLSESGDLTRMHAWGSTWYWVMSRFIFSWTFVQRLFLNFVLAPRVARSKVLDFIAATEPFEGRHKWLHPLLNSGNKEPSL
ncbi:2-heptyl-3-hydroxy-4(1H)-quinolone synthase 1 [Colletotrichum chlorophyti]|uniref:2-heptyl-3-hydroxy-4(1H)-quinolone synthase 1 n=1 Tax=Colletotrichum chlorophyti TaxID=708187 RepID=A0A1Q8RRP7_9PEZI|nr:2-heptyl-3-hydroxy-4(1H)-quinolone synthase 1 [Colletotrichum chlorophyti]